MACIYFFFRFCLLHGKSPMMIAHVVVDDVVVVIAIAVVGDDIDVVVKRLRWYSIIKELMIG